jgi:hypothetical protein
MATGNRIQLSSPRRTRSGGTNPEPFIASASETKPSAY